MSKKLKILVVEDEITNSLLMKRLLTKAGYEVTVSFNGDQALAELEKDNFDGIVSDWMMPKMDGIELIRRIKEKVKPQPYIVIVTALVSDGAKTHSLESGADDYIAKPIDINNFLKKLEQGLEKRAALVFRGEMNKEVQNFKKPNHIAVGIATSTGGPPSLLKLFKEIEHNLKASYFIVQHGPPWMLETFSQKLNNETNFDVNLAYNNHKIIESNVLIAPGDNHMAVNESFELSLGDGPKENFVRPSADVLFRSIAKTYGENSIAVVLTGLGKDGALGSLAIEKVGGSVIVQDPNESTASSMPNSTIETCKTPIISSINSIAELIKKEIEKKLKKG